MFEASEGVGPAANAFGFFEGVFGVFVFGIIERVVVWVGLGGKGVMRGCIYIWMVKRPLRGRMGD